MKKEENRKTACEAKQEENFSLCGNSGNQSLSAENAGEEKSNAGEKKRDADGIKGDTSEKKRKNGYFSRGEAILWIVSVCVITVAFAFSPEKNYLSLVASLIGVMSLIFIAKGNPIGQALTIVFSVLYGIISYTFAYYGEMIIYLAMTAPMAVLALAEWLKNPYEGRKNEVKIRKLPLREYFFAALLAAAVTAIFYSALFSHGESCLEHRFRDDEFSCRLLHVPPKPALCAGICGERRGADCAVVAGDGGKSRVFIRGSLLFRVSSERYIRILQLEKNAGGAIAGSRA